MESIDITSTDKTTNKLCVFTAPESKKIVCIFPAMGVRGSYYQRLGEELARIGISAATIDLRGHGHSGLRPSSKTNFGYHEMVEYDYPAVVETLKLKYPNQAIYLLGHSLGGQLAALYASKNPKSIQGLILVACCSVYYKGWTGLGRLRALAGTQFINLVANTLGYYPGHKMGFGGLEAKGMIRDWSRQARTGNYLPDNADFNFEQGLKQLQLPVFALSFQGDDFAPKKAVDILLDKLENNNQTSHLHLKKEDPHNEKYNHFNWAKRPKGVGAIIKEWLERY